MYLIYPMPHSQNYCLVSFIEPVDLGSEFDMADWPLHVTLADVFSINLEGSNIELKLQELLSTQRIVSSITVKETVLGTTKVLVIEKTAELNVLHTNIVNLLEDNGAIFNNPEYTREGFLPHCTIQKTQKLHTAQQVEITTIALIDMFPNENWQQRKVISLFSLQPYKIK